MSHTHSSNLVHCVFSTKERRPLIEQDGLSELHSYFSGIAEGEGFPLLAAGGTANHAHLLFALPPTIALADAVQTFKGSSSRWLGRSFAWQEGYGAFSVSPSQAPRVKTYIRNQIEHHRTRSFEDEFLALLKKCGSPYDPRYVFG